MHDMIAQRTTASCLVMIQNELPALLPCMLNSQPFLSQLVHVVDKSISQGRSEIYDKPTCRKMSKSGTEEEEESLPPLHRQM